MGAESLTLDTKTHLPVQPSSDFNNASQLVQLDNMGRLPAVDGSQLTGIASGVPVVVAQNTAAFVTVTATGLIADSGNTAHYGKVAGITPVSVLSGNLISLTAEGELINPSWSWSPGDNIFLNGTSLSNVPPSVGFAQKIGTARNATTMIVKLEIPILL